jgi:hypothetical protein
MKLFNWVNGVTNRQLEGEDLAAQISRRSIHPGQCFSHISIRITPAAFPR